MRREARSRHIIMKILDNKPKEKMLNIVREKKLLLKVSIRLTDNFFA